MNGESPKPRSHRKGTLPAIPKSLQTEADRAAVDPGDLDVGDQVRQSKVFDIVEPVGEGGMGRVFRAFDPVMDRYVALKVIKPDVPQTERERFRREAVIAANFSHPNLTRVLDRGRMEGGDVEWMTMEYLRGRDLGLIIDLGRNVPVPLIVDIFGQALDALDYIHTRGIVHCDVKPDNIFVTRDPYDRRIVVVKLIDFGVCRHVDDPPPQRVIGDPRYMAPEQISLATPMDSTTDLYALGITMFETLSGWHPFPGADEMETRELLANQIETEMPSVSTVVGSLPEEAVRGIDAIMARACAKDQRQRFQSAREMKLELEGLLATADV